MLKEFIAEGLELLTLISSIFLLMLILLFILKFVLGKKTKLYDFIVHFLQNHYLFLGFLISIVATLGSLFYSDIMSFEPCKLCWYQRIFMYPQPLLFLIAMKIKNKSIIFNSIVLSFIGMLIASYHYLLQINAINAVSCDVVGYSVSCSEYFSLAYGFITIPMMALIAFALLIVIGYGKIRALQKGHS